jgi:hypothetical protein
MIHNEYISEGYAQSEEDWVSKWELQTLLGVPNPLTNWERPKNNRSFVNLALERYEVASAAKVGDTIHCPTCNCKFVKKTYQQKFHRIKCKNRYWNSVDDDRRERAKKFN